jgi:hypothetical protein
MIRKRLQVLTLAVTLGTTVTALAAPPGDRSGRSVRNSSPASGQKVQQAPKTFTPKFDPKVVKPQVVKPIDKPKVDVPKVVKPQVELPKVIKPVDPPKVKPVDQPKFTKPADIKVFKPQVVEPKGKLAGLPGLKLPGNAKFNPAELAKLKPALDAKKLKPGELGKLKPPADFKVKPLDLGKLKLPDNAPAVGKLNAGLKFNDKFVMNKNFYQGGDYHLKFGKKIGTSFCYPGIHHSHWHHCLWDPWYNCNYYYCPSTCCYYYWSPGDYCYYPCWWFVDYGGCNYPWWLCGDYGMHMYGSGFSLHIGF